MAEPTPEELGPLLGSSAPLDDPAADPYEGENSAFMSAAKAAVGGGSDKALALKDAIVECLREHGLLGEPAEEGDEDAALAELGDVGEGFPDF